MTYSGKTTSFNVTVISKQINVSSITLSSSYATITREVTSVTLSSSNATVYDGSSPLVGIECTRKDAYYSLGVTVSPNNATNPTIVATSSNKSVATVSVQQNGSEATIEIVGIYRGKATITVQSAENSSICQTFDVTVMNGQVDCSSSDTSIVKVSAMTAGADPNDYKYSVDGMYFSYVNDGSAKAYVKYKGTTMATCSISCKKNNVVDMYLNTNYLEFTSGGGMISYTDSYVLYAMYENGDKKDITKKATFSSSDPSIATFIYGTIKWYDKKGTVTITATYNGYSKQILTIVVK